MNDQEARHIEQILIDAIFSGNIDRIKYATNRAFVFLSKEQKEREEERKNIFYYDC